MKIEIYTTNHCAYCKLVKKWLSDHNLEFEEKNVETNKEWQNELIERSGQYTVPFTAFGGKHFLLGFDGLKLQKIVDKFK